MGDPDDLLAGYDRLMAGMPEDQVEFHACAVREAGITIYDARPAKDAFEVVLLGGEVSCGRGRRASLVDQDRGAAASRCARPRRPDTHLIEATT